MAEKSSKSTLAEQTISLSEKSSFPKTAGEQLGPLFIIVMQCCLVYAILMAVAGFFAETSSPLLPFWLICLLFFGLYGLGLALNRFVFYDQRTSLTLQQRKILARALMCTALIACLIFCIWLRFYASQFWLVDPNWLLELTNQFGDFDRVMQMVVLAVLIVVITWLNYQMGDTRSDTAVLLRKGGTFLVILVAIKFGEGILAKNPDVWQAFLLLPIFFWCGLTNQSLQKASAKRHHYKVGLEGSTRHQENIIFQFMALLGVVGLIAGCLIILTSTPITHVQVSNVSMMPVLAFPKPTVQPKPTPTAATPTNQSSGVVQLAASTLLNIVLFIAGGILLTGVSYTLWLIWRLWRKRKPHTNHKPLERRSLWSWSLFLNQIASLLRRLFPLLKWRFQHKGRSQERSSVQPEQAQQRTIREIYRSFLAQATNHGQSRQPDETPYEFQQKLAASHAQLNPELTTLTEAYTQVRYAGTTPETDDITRARATLYNLQQKWEE